jgi:hypothetical protein
MAPPILSDEQLVGVLNGDLATLQRHPSAEGL